MRSVSRKRRVGLTRLALYVRDQRRRIALLSLAAAFTSAVQVGGWLLVGDAIDNGIRAHDTSRLDLDVALYVGFNAVAWLVGSFLIMGLAQLGQLIVLRLREHLFGHLTTLSLRYFSEQRAGWIISRITNDVDALSDVLSEGLSTLVGNVLTLTGAMIALAILDWRLALATMVILPPTMIVARWFQVRSHTAFADVRTRISALTAQVAESLAGMAVIQSYNREGAFRKQFSELNRANQRSNQHAQNLSSIFFPAIELFGVIATVAVLALGSRLYEDGTLTLGTLIAFIGLLSLLFQPLQELSELYGQVQSAAAAMEKITTVLDVEADIASPAGARRIERVEGHVELDCVTFAYGREPVLHGIELDIPAGSCIALVGMSGGGKSTLARLVGRFYDPREGAVRVDGNDLREIDLVHYRRQLGVVLQDPFLFAGSIADNLRFAAPDASDERVEGTARAIGLDRVAARFSKGLDHVVREGGSGLSAGERQLISIGRALLADPRILILDEATSNIDRPTEVLIEKALDRLLHGRTSIVIAHRLATVRRADEIVVLERGRIVERGSEAELMAAHGHFAALARELAAPAAAVVDS
jgi:ABC-type multidrug transport system fused ATPase/permease subunit